MVSIDNWLTAHEGAGEIKAIVGLRGVGKASVLWKRYASDAFFLDFTNPSNRRIKTAEQVVEYLKNRERDTVTRLVIIEPTYISGHTRMLRRIYESGKWNVYFTSSNAHVLEHAKENWPECPVAVYRMWTADGLKRHGERLSHIWDAIFVRDVADGLGNVDVRRIGDLAEYYSDHIGEVVHDREVARSLKLVGEMRSAPSITKYRKALMKAYLIDVCEGYDCFNDTVVRNSGRMFWTDMGLRQYRFGAAPKREMARAALNRLYIKLRREHGVVYWPHDRPEYDFVTIDADGGQKFWRR